MIAGGESIFIGVAPGALAQAGAGGMVRFLAWVGLFIILLAVAGTALLVYRRRVLSGEGPADQQRGLLDRLRAMRDRGEITGEEYDAARRTIAGHMAGRGGRAPPRASPRRSPEADERIAPPGFDLSGAPLPRPRNDGADGGRA